MAGDQWKRRLERANIWFAAVCIAFFVVVGGNLIVRAIGPHPPGGVILLILVLVAVIVHRVIEERGAD